MAATVTGLFGAGEEYMAYTCRRELSPVAVAALIEPFVVAEVSPHDRGRTARVYCTAL